jgi:hypothetical protein
MRRLVTVLLFVLLALDIIGASGQVNTRGIVKWPVGPCELYRRVNQSEMVLSCFDSDVAQLWPLPWVVQEGPTRQAMR